MIIGMIKAHPTDNPMPRQARPEREGSERPRAVARPSACVRYFPGRLTFRVNSPPLEEVQ